MVTIHAVEELEDEGLSVLDVERAILTGKIARRQRDGRTLSNADVVVVAKLSPTDKLVIITIYGEENK